MGEAVVTGSSASKIYLLNEFTDLCNLKCVMCDHGRKGKKIHGEYPFGLMDQKVFEKIIQRLKESRVQLDTFHAGWLGEPLCHPEIVSLFKVLFSENKKQHFFDSFTMNTNALPLTKELADLFLDHAESLEKRKDGYMRLHLSIHAATREMYEAVTCKTGSNLDIVLANVDYLMAERKRRGLRFPSLTFLFVVTETNKNEAKQFLEFWKGRLKKYKRKYEVLYDWPENYPDTDTDAIYFRREDAYEQYKAEELHKKVVHGLGLIDKKQLEKRVVRTDAILRKNAQEDCSALRRPCPALWRTAVVHNTGLVVPCCSDLHIELVIGDFKKQSLDEIWDGSVLSDMRLAHIRGDFKKYQRCYYCNNIDSFVISDAEIVDYLKETHHEEEIEPFLARMGAIRKRSLSGSRGFLNICLVSREYPTETGWGGIGTYTYELAHGLAERGHQVHVLALGLKEDQEYQDGLVHVHRISHRDIFTPKRYLLEFLVRFEYSQRVYKKLNELIEKYGIDVVEVPNFFAEGFVFSLFHKVPLVTRLHSSFDEVIGAYGWGQQFDRKLSCSLEDAAVLRSDLITSSTKICSQMMAKRLRLDPGKVAVIPLGILLPSAESLVASRESLQDRNPEIFFLGRLERRKGAHILMKAIPEVLKEIPNAHFTFLGRDTFVNANYSAFEGPQQESFKATMLKDFPGQHLKSVDFLGFVEKELLPGYFQNCDLFVAPSLYESFGLIYIEAMAYGKPVIGCKTGGVPEVIKDGETGLLVPPEDPQSLAQAIIKLLKDPKLRREMGQRGRKHVEANFKRELMVERTVAAYQEAVKSKRK